MPGELKQTIERVSNKAKILVERYHVLLESKRQADARILEQDAMILAQKKEIESLRQQVEYLQIATNVIPDNSQTERTRTLISTLVREIDRCINDLTQGCNERRLCDNNPDSRHRSGANEYTP